MEQPFIQWRNSKRRPSDDLDFSSSLFTASGDSALICCIYICLSSSIDHPQKFVVEVEGLKSLIVPVLAVEWLPRGKAGDFLHVVVAAGDAGVGQLVGMKQ
jgi:hypothetical protein